MMPAARSEAAMGLFDGTKFERPVTCEVCGTAMAECTCPRDAAGKVLLPSKQTAVIRLEKRPGGRVMTLVEGLDPVASDLPALLKALKSRCAAGGAVSEGVIEIQGDHGDAAAQHLESLGYRTRRR
jgi:translation initiation factor 1